MALHLFKTPSLGFLANYMF